jgi:hypothetical protein
MLGCPGIDGVDYDLRLTLNQCLSDIRNTYQDLPAKQHFSNSNAIKPITTPSQRFADLETELGELECWFESEIEPDFREEVSAGALSAMLGEAPFGDDVLVVEKIDAAAIVAEGETAGKANRSIYCAEVLSRDPQVRQDQIEFFSNLRTISGVPLSMAIHEENILRPISFVNFVRAFRENRRVEDMKIEELGAAVANDFEAMRLVAKRAASMIALLRKDLDKKGKVTIAQWARCEPVFRMIRSMIERVWPIQNGQPSVDAVGEERSTAPSTRRLLNDLAINLIDLAQANVNQMPEFKSERFEDIRGPNKIIGTTETYDDQVIQLVSLILSLRLEHTSYCVVRHTIAGICDALFDRCNDDILIAASNLVSTDIITKLDNRIALGKLFLDYGSDRVHAKRCRWFGRLDPDARRRWRQDVTYISMVFPILDSDKSHHLSIFDSLIRTLDVTTATLTAWNQLTQWASTTGAGYWNIVRP